MSGLSVAVDAGTSFIKVVVLDEDGLEVGASSRPTAVLHPRPDRSEQDMAEVRDAVTACIADATRGRRDEVARLAVTAQGDGAWIVDAAGAPTGPAVLWNDGRAVAEVRAWRERGLLERAFRVNGSLFNLGLPNAILAWLRAHEPDRLEGAASVLTCGSWLHRCLTGTTGLHPTEASAPWLDLASGEVSDELLELTGLAWARPLVPPVLGRDEQTSPLSPAAADATGLRVGLPVTLAPYDVVSTATGSGALAAGDAFCILGTTLCVGTLLEAPDTRGTPSGLTLLGGEGRPVTRAFPTLAGTGVVDWAAGLLGLAHAADLVELAGHAAPGSDGIRMWPYLSPAGERAPFLDTGATGVLAGLRFGTGRAEFARAVLEGLAHVIRDCLDAAGPAPATLALAGGGARSDLWCRTVADVAGVPVVRRARGQEGARGAIVAALVAEGGVDEAAAVADAAPAGDRFEPDPDAADAAAARHEDFLGTREVLASRWGAWERS